MTDRLFAYCWRDGRIELGAETPENALPLYDGPAAEVRETIEGNARLAYDNATLLVPGVPEADSDDEALDAVLRFRDWLHTRPQDKTALEPEA